MVQHFTKPSVKDLVMRAIREKHNGKDELNEALIVVYNAASDLDNTMIQVMDLAQRCVASTERIVASLKRGDRNTRLAEFQPCSIELSNACVLYEERRQSFLQLCRAVGLAIDLETPAPKAS